MKALRAEASARICGLFSVRLTGRQGPVTCGHVATGHERPHLPRYPECAEGRT